MQSMGISADCYDLENAITRPATDERLVEALLAFAHGSEVVIRQSDEVRRWSLWRERPSEVERAALVGLLQRIMRKPGGALGVAPGPWRGLDAAIELDSLVASSEYAMPVNEYQLDTCLAHMNKSIERKFVLVPVRRGGYSLVDYPRYLNVAAALTAAMLLVADPSQPYARALCRCKGCDRFYIARRTKKGQLANGVYHDPECRAKYHNSAARKG
jgi:hypothetical protein